MKPSKHIQMLARIEAGRRLDRGDEYFDDIAEILGNDEVKIRPFPESFEQTFEGIKIPNYYTFIMEAYDVNTGLYYYGSLPELAKHMNVPYSNIYTAYVGRSSKVDMLFRTVAIVDTPAALNKVRAIKQDTLDVWEGQFAEACEYFDIDFMSMCDILDEDIPKNTYKGYYFESIKETN